MGCDELVRLAGWRNSDTSRESRPFQNFPQTNEILFKGRIKFGAFDERLEVHFKLGRTGGNDPIDFPGLNSFKLYQASLAQVSQMLRNIDLGQSDNLLEVADTNRLLN